MAESKDAQPEQSAEEQAREEAKAKMREALDRKKAQQRSGERGRNTGSVHGPEVAGGAGQKRFRRKSG